MPRIVSPIDPTDLPGDTAAGAIAHVARVRALLIATAGRGKPISYSELLDALGHRFTRPKMRALCKTLDAIDAAGAAAGEPELAVLVVRETDGLPGQGWWTGGRPMREGYEGQWTGPEADRVSSKTSRSGRSPTGPDRSGKTKLPHRSVDVQHQYR